MIKTNNKIYKWKMLSLVLGLTIMQLPAQSLSLDSCLDMAYKNFPLVKQYDLIQQSKEFTIGNANKGYLPQFNIAGQATYQSAVTQLPINIPGVGIELPKDQYKIYGEVTQSITDVFTIKNQKQLITVNAEIEKQNTEVETYKLKDRIHQLFFGILMIDEQLVQNDLLAKDIQSGINKTTVAVENGTATNADLSNLKAELLNIKQQATNLKANKNAYAQMLSYFIGKPLDENTVLQKPEKKLVSDKLNRPELKLFDLQQNALQVQNTLLSNRRLPRFSLFFQGGLGRPALNILSEDVEAYYIGGLRLNWDISSFYTLKNERKNLNIQKKMIDVKKETFVFNTNLNLKQQNTEILKLEELLKVDKDIIALREVVKNTTQVKLENGKATVNDYIIAANAENKARQNLTLHEIQLLLAQYNYENTSGN